MLRPLGGLAMAMTLCLTVSLVHGEQRGRGSEKPAGNKEGEKPGSSKAPGGDWSDRTHSGKQSPSQFGSSGQQGHAGAEAGYADKNKASQPTGAQGAAAGAAAADKNKNSQPTGAQGAAAGAAAVNRNSPPVSGAQGAAAGAAVANRNAPAVSGATGAAAGYTAVRNSFNDTNIYGQQWYGQHPGVWAPSGWAAGAAWQPSTQSAVSGFCGYGSAAPISYDYGVNVTAQNGNVLVNGQSVGTTGEFSQQASDLAASGAAADTSATDKWLPLGVFAMVRDEHQQPQFIVQLAINKQGILRGNYTDDIADHTLPIHGAADKKTQRAAWTVGDNQQTVMEAGLNDLTDNEAPALIHKNGKTDHWLLVRLEQPKQAGSAAAK